MVLLLIKIKGVMGWERGLPEDERRIRGKNNAVTARINGITIKNRGDKS